MIAMHHRLWSFSLAILFGFLPDFLLAQELSLTFGEGESVTGTSVQLIALITVLSLAPGIIITITCFPFVLTVLAILRQAIGLQQSPPNMLIVSLALFITWFVMEPVFLVAWAEGIQPFVEERQTISEAIPRAFEPFKTFMAARTDPNTMAILADLRGSEVDRSNMSNTPASILLPSFMLSEMSRAFQVGFLLFLPFLVIDLVVAAVLMSMGMMMVPPAMVSLPFKLAFFVVADGWTLLSDSLVHSYF